MCILLCSLSHPDYRIVLGSNRDEFFQRPTAPAAFIDDNVIMPMDLAREEHGTWIGVSKTGRICVLVNYQENVYPGQIGAISRGCISKDFLASELDPLDWIAEIRARTDNFANIGGFSLFFGTLNSDKGPENTLYVISNRDDHIIQPFKDSDRKALGLSNSSFFNPWPKVKEGEHLMAELLQRQDATPQSESELVTSIFDIMSVQSDAVQPGSSLDDTLKVKVQSSIFVPVLKNDLVGDIEQHQGPTYGTRTQTVFVVSNDGQALYAEKDVLSGTTTEHRFSIASPSQ